jgi:hypothetical protein
VAALQLTGRPSEQVLESALAEVQSLHPLLRARLVREGSRWSFETAPGAVPLRKVERRSDDHWREVVEEELNHQMDTANAPLVRCCLLASAVDGEASEIVLSLHHAIVDVASAATVFRQLLTICGGGTGGGTGGGPGGGTQTADELPPAPETRFPARFRGLSRYPAIAAFVARQMAEEVGYLWRSRGLRSAVPASSARCRVLSMELGEAATKALVRRCRRQRVPVNGALNAALLLAVQRHRYAGRPLPLRYFAFPDLRPYLEPPMEPEMVVSCLTTMRFTIGLGTEERFWRLAGRISRQLRDSFRRGEKFLFCMTSTGILRMLIRFGRMRFGAAAVSYSGPLAFPSTYGELGVVGMHGFVSNMPIGAEFVGQARLFRGRLCWDFVYLDADMDETGARGLVADIQKQLEEAAHERD